MQLKKTNSIAVRPSTTPAPELEKTTEKQFVEFLSDNDTRDLSAINDIEMIYALLHVKGQLLSATARH